MTRAWTIVLLVAWLATTTAAQRPGAVTVRAERLPSLPEGRAVAGAFAGVSRGALIVAGGASFPGGRPWDGAEKVWHDVILVLPPGADAWRPVPTRLPRASAYGVSLTHGDRVLCLGGGDADRHHDAAYSLRWDDDRQHLSIEPLPSLPTPVAFSCGALLGDLAVVLGGLDAPDAGRPLGRGFSLDLSDPDAAWVELPPWPGAPRMLATSGAQDGSVFLFGGADLRAAERVPLRDGFRYAPATGWAPIAMLPRAVIAAPSPAPATGQAHLLVFGGDDGERGGVALRGAHPGFLRDVLAYHTPTDTWRTLGRLPTGAVPTPPVTTPAVPWRDGFVLPSGESSPGVRTRDVVHVTVARASQPFAPLDHVVLAAYLLALIAVGVHFGRRGSSTDDFFLGGRRIPWWAAGLSIFGTQLSAITFMAIPALVFRTDWVYLFGSLTIVLIAPVVVRAYLPQLRRQGVTTAYELLERRFSLGVRLCASAAFLLFQTGRMGILLYLPSIALSTVTGIDTSTCILGMGVLATLYTVLGGIEAVIWTDVLQVVVLLGGAIASLGVVLLRLDVPLTDAVADAADAGKLRVATLGWDPTTTVLWVVVLGRLLENLVPYTSDQTVVQRYLTVRDERAAARSIWTNAVLSVPATLLFFTVGTALWAHYRAHPEQLDPNGRHDDVFAWFVAHELPAGLSGLVIAGLFAASMSSLDSSMNSMATAISTDWIERLRRRRTGERVPVRVARCLTLALGTVGTASALWLAAIETTSLWDQYTRIVGLFGGGLAGLFALAVFSPRTHAIGAAIGFVASAVVLWLVTPHVHFFLYAGIGLCSCCLIGRAASALVPAPPA